MAAEDEPFLGKDENVYRRFVFAKLNKETRHREGILRNRRSGGWGVRRIAAIYVWLSRNLPRPPRDAFSGTRALCWFKPEARACIDQVVDLAQLLQRRGERIWQLQTRYPGLITYEDEFQVVAIPASEFEAVAPEAPSLPGGPGGAFPC
jgi:hypothetical protein